MAALLREADGFEGLSPVGEGLQSCDFPVFDLVEPGARLLRLDATGTAASAPMTKDQDSVAEIAKLLVVHLEELPIHVEVFDPPLDIPVSTVDTTFQDGQDRHPLHVWIKQIQ